MKYSILFILLFFPTVAHDVNAFFTEEIIGENIKIVNKLNDDSSLSVIENDTTNMQPKDTTLLSINSTYQQQCLMKSRTATITGWFLYGGALALVTIGCSYSFVFVPLGGLVAIASMVLLIKGYS